MPKRFFWITGTVLFLILAKLAVGVVHANSLLLATDLSFENFLLAHRTPSLLHFFNLITMLGNTVVVIAIVLVVGAWLFFSRFHNAYVIGLVTTLVGAGGTDFIMKALIERARPNGLIPATIETSSSFPSGHATFSMALYGFLTYFLCKHYPKYSPLFITLGSLLILAIAFSRLYLGVHFPSDVVAGLTLGALWLLIGIEVTKRFLTTWRFNRQVITNPSSPS